jgi:hypothetical protein
MAVQKWPRCLAAHLTILAAAFVTKVLSFFE